MSVAVISDIHENFHNLLRALEVMRERGVNRVLCLGDLMNAGIASVLAGCGLPTLAVWGNNDGDRVSILRVALAPGSGLQVADQTYASLEIEGRRLFCTHHPDLAGPIARSGDFDAVFYGHDHRHSVAWIGACLVANPGEVSGHKTGEATFCLYEPGRQAVEIVPIPDAITLRSEYVLGHPAWQQAHNR